MELSCAKFKKRLIFQEQDFFTKKAMNNFFKSPYR